MAEDAGPLRVIEESPAYWRIVFDYPPFNIVDATLYQALQDLLARMDASPSLRVVVFESANPEFFLAHFDLTGKTGNITTAVGLSGLPILIDTFVRISRSPVASIAKIRGCVRGVSSEFVLACDMRFASRENTLLGHTGFIAVIGGPIHRSHWLYFSGKWETPQLMDKWQSEPKHKPMQDAAHSRWFASVYLRKWRLPADNEPLSGPLLCELAIARQDPLEQATIDRILDEIVHPSLQLHEALKFETLTGEFEKQPCQFVGPVQEFPVLAPARYLLITHWATDNALQGWLKSDAVKQLSAYGEVSSTISVPIKHDVGEREYLRPDGLQRDAVH